MAPSPSTSLNTPAGMLGGTVPSPIQDDQIKEKIQKLRKYIDPLKRMISKMTLDGCKNSIKIKLVSFRIFIYFSFIIDFQTLKKRIK